VAFARHRRKPRSVDLDLASSIRFDRAGCTQIAHQERHGRSSHTEYLRDHFLREREDVVADAVAKMQQPACHAGLHRVQRIAGGAELELCQHRADMSLERVTDRGALVESAVKAEGGNPRGGPCHMHDGGNGRR